MALESLFRFEVCFRSRSYGGQKLNIIKLTFPYILLSVGTDSSCTKVINCFGCATST